MFNFFKRKKYKTVIKNPNDKESDYKETKSKKNEQANLEQSSIKTEEQFKKDNEKPVKRHEFFVKESHIEERQKLIGNLVKELKKEDYFELDKYDGLTNKEIKEDYLEERIYEYGDHPLPKGYLEDDADNPNDIKVFITNLKGEKLHLGYVPKDLCQEIREMKEKYICYVAPSLDGGKFKMAVLDDLGEEKIITGVDEYRVKVYLSFWEELPYILQESEIEPILKPNNEKQENKSEYSFETDDLKSTISLIDRSNEKPNPPVTVLDEFTSYIAPVVDSPPERGYEYPFRKSSDGDPIYKINQKAPKGMPKKLKGFVSVTGIKHYQNSAKEFVKGNNKMVVLEKEPQNEHDSNAIAVYGVWNDEKGENHKEQVGHISKNVAGNLRNEEVIGATIKQIFLPTTNTSLGIKIDVWGKRRNKNNKNKI